MSNSQERYQDVWFSPDTPMYQNRVSQGEPESPLSRVTSTSKPKQPLRASTMDSESSLSTSANTIYERLLLRQNHGYPLWNPNPNSNLPKSYFDKGVGVGDVGIITASGSFDYLFNICHNAEHPNNAGPLPEGFLPILTQKDKDINEGPEHISGSYFLSPSVLHTKGLHFETTGAEGAVLAMPDGAFHEDIRNLTKFREYASQHAHSWYKLANGVLGRDVENGEMHLVTGCDKVSSWGIAAWPSDGVTHDSLCLQTEETRDGFAYRWDSMGRGEFKAYPVPLSSQKDNTRNQCTFVRTHTISLCDEEWQKLSSSFATPPSGSTSPEAGTPVDTVTKITHRSRRTLRRIFSSFGPRSSNSAQSSGVSLMSSTSECIPKVTHPGTTVNRVLLQKCPKARLAVTHDEDWALLSHDALSTANIPNLWDEITERFDVIVDPSGLVHLQVKDVKPDGPNSTVGFSELVLGMFPFADTALPGGLDESDFTVESLIEILTSPTSPSPSHVRVLSRLLKKQTPPRFSALQPVLHRLCSLQSEPTLQALGYRVMMSYWNNPKVKNASWPTTSDALSCLTFFLDVPPTWSLDLWEVRFKALAAVTKHGNDLRGIETLIVKILQSCIGGAFELLTNPPKGMPVPPPSECERCISSVGTFLANMLAYDSNVARFKEETLMTIFDFYANLIDKHIRLPSPNQKRAVAIPLETSSPNPLPKMPHDRTIRKGHKKRAPSFTSLLFSSSPTVSNELPPFRPPPKSKDLDPADIALSLFLEVASTHLIHLSPEAMSRVLPVMFRALGYCLSPLPRLTAQPRVIGSKTMEDQIVDILNALLPSPSSNVVLQVLKAHLVPTEICAPQSKPSGGQDAEEDEEESVLRGMALAVLTSLGAYRTLRNYMRRVLVVRLERASSVSQEHMSENEARRQTADQDILDVGWLQYDRMARLQAESPDTRALAAGVDAWLAWSPEASQGEQWDHIMDGKENILEECAGLLKDVFQEIDEREDGGLTVELGEHDPMRETLRSLANYILTLKSPDGSRFIINAFDPGDSPFHSSQLLRSITTLLSRDFPGPQKSMLAEILIRICDHITDENTTRIPALFGDNYGLSPMDPSWLDNWKKILIPPLLSSSKPQTRAAIVETLCDIYESVKESAVFRKGLADVVMDASTSLISGDPRDRVYTILEEETISLIVERAQNGGGEAGSDNHVRPVDILKSLIFIHQDTPIANAAVQSLIAIFSEIAFTSLSFVPANQELAASIFNTFLRALEDLKQPEARIVILQFLMRLRADRDHRVYFALHTNDTNESITYLASLIDRLPNALMRAHKDEILEEHVARHRSTRPRVPSRMPTQKDNPQQPNRGRSHTVLDPVREREPERPRLWCLPEVLPFKIVEADSVRNGMRSFHEDGIKIPVSKYIFTLAKLIEADSSWELVSYILCHLPVQLANKHLFCGLQTRASIIQLLYTLCKGVIDSTLGSQTGNDHADGLKPRDLRGLAYHTLSTLISYRVQFDLKQRQLLVEAFYSGLNGPFSTIKCCLHALSLCAFEMSTSLAKCLPKILEKLAQIMSNPNMAVHILAFLVMVGSMPSLYASFTDNDFKMVFGVALQYLQHYNQLKESPTRSWALSQHVRQQSFVTLYTWFQGLSLTNRIIHIPYITRQLLLATEGRDTVDGLTQACFDWLARNSYGTASAETTVLPDLVMQPNVAKPGPVTGKVWLVEDSFLTISDMKRPGWVDVISRRPSGSAEVMCRKEDFLRMAKEYGVFNHFGPALMEGEAGQEEADSEDDSTLDTEAAEEQEFTPMKFASHLLFDMSPLRKTSIAVQAQDYVDENDVRKAINNLDRNPVIDTHQVGIMYAAPGQTGEREILRNSHGSQAYTRFLDGIGNLVRLGAEKDVYTGSLDPGEDGDYAYAWWDDIRQILFHTCTIMPFVPDDSPVARKKRHVGNDFVRVIWNDSGVPYAFDTLATQFQFVNIVIEPHSMGVISAFSNDTQESEYFRVIVQTAEGMTECTPVGQFKIVSAASLPHFIRHLCIFTDCFTTIFAATSRDQSRTEIKSSWDRRLDSIERYRKKNTTPALPQNEMGSSRSSSLTRTAT